MLKSLSIENIAVIEKCNIEFSNGFNCLTGETGAGKSIVIDAINAVTGQRTSKELIRTNCDKAVVSALFEVSERISDLLCQYGVTVDEDKTVLVSRTISADGKNNCRINGVAVNVAALREVGGLLVNIHGQHDNQALLNPDNHCGYIDSYGDYSEKLSAYRECYDRLKIVRKRLKTLKLDTEEKQRQRNLLSFQVSEIDQAAVKPGELDELIRRRDVVRNAEKIGELLESAHSGLSGDEDTKGAVGLVSDAAAYLLGASRLYSDVKGLSERLIAVSSELSDITAELRRSADDVGFDPNELDELEQRIDILKSLIKKYGEDEAAVLAYRDRAADELDALDTSEQTIAELEAESDALDEEIFEKGSLLTAARKSTAKAFSEKVCEVLKYLEMPNVIFSTDISEGIYTANGCDKVEFLISANLGQEPKQLSKVASGGELSRTMLAVKSVLSDENGPTTLIFDEIDTGISGKAADKVGKQLRRLSANKQVICVTHLAQIAAAADCHLLISKSTVGNETYTNVAPIIGDDRINEIARIVSGGEMTENLYKTAKELIENHTNV